MKDAPRSSFGRRIAINKSSRDIEGAVRLTKHTNMAQLVSGNHITVWVDDMIKEELIFRAGIQLTAHQAESIIFRNQDWPFQLKVEDIE